MSTDQRREDSSFLGRLTFSYISPLIKYAQKHNLEPKDYPKIETLDESELLCEKLKEAWDNEQEKNPKHPKLWKVAWNVVGPEYILAGFAFLIETLIVTTQPVLLAYLLNFLQNPLANLNDGYLFAAGLSVSILIVSVNHHAAFFQMMRAGMKMRVGFIALIYKKLLQISVAHTASSGIIVNMVSNDVQRFEDSATFLSYAFIGPLQVVLSTIFMYMQIGPSSFGSLVALLLFIPLQGFFAKQFGILRKKTVMFRDERIRSLSDMFVGMMVVKLNAWEKPFCEKIGLVRDQELKYIQKAAVIRAFNEAFSFASTAVISAFALLPYVLAGGVLTPAKYGSESLVSFARIQKFLSIQDIDIEVKMDNSILKEQEIIAFKNASFAWKIPYLESNVPKPHNSPVSKLVADNEILKNISLSIMETELVFLVGPVGSGKSSLFNAILGEMSLTKGEFAVRQGISFAYASQNPWIVNGTFKDNILFGKPYDHQWFQQVVEACALVADLKQFSNGENSIIGERGSNLSGGQRARLALARALYSRADIYILDDPLSAVDAQVGKHLFENCIDGLMKNSVRILVTHQLQYICAHHKVVLLEKGTITSVGTYKNVVQSNTPFAQIMVNFIKNVDTEVTEEVKIQNEKEIFDVEDADGKTLEVENAEKSATGSVSWNTYYQFFTAGTSNAVVSVLAIAMILGQVSLLMTDFWLSQWAMKPSSSQESEKATNTTVFVGLTLITLLVSLGRAILFFVICLKSTRAIFNKMMMSVSRSPMSFFHNNPAGRLLNRFAKDLNIADEMIPLTVFDFLQCSCMILGTLGTAIAVIPYILLVVPLLSLIFYYLRKYFVAASRQIKRIESVTRSPVYSYLTSTLEGLSLIRAFKAEHRFRKEFVRLQNENTRMYFSFLSSSRWLGLRLDLLATGFLTGLVFFSVVFKDTLSSNVGTIGLVLTYCLQMLGLLQWAVRQSAEVENLMISAERTLEYTELPSEAAEITELRPPKNWPIAGMIDIQSMSLTYPGKDKPVLKDLSIHIAGGTKVGIVGRTGAGKSSFLQALFRLVEPVPKGSIKIDGLDIGDLGLYDLRSRISIIPQEPFCFKGTLRFNIDPFNSYSDDLIWKTLEAVELKAAVEKHAEKLESAISDNGGNWSFGERQLICLARAILRNTNLIVMDEATSAIDLRTDALVQKAIRSNESDGLFRNATVITIAHRINTVIDFDYIMVLDQGKLVEYGKPFEMLEKDPSNPDAWLRRIVDDMGDEARESLRKLAKIHYDSSNSK